MTLVEGLTLQEFTERLRPIGKAELDRLAADRGASLPANAPHEDRIKAFFDHLSGAPAKRGKTKKVPSQPVDGVVAPLPPSDAPQAGPSDLRRVRVRTFLKVRRRGGLTITPSWQTASVTEDQLADLKGDKVVFVQELGE